MLDIQLFYCTYSRRKATKLIQQNKYYKTLALIALFIIMIAIAILLMVIWKYYAGGCGILTILIILLIKITEQSKCIKNNFNCKTVQIVELILMEFFYNSHDYYTRR